MTNKYLQKPKPTGEAQVIPTNQATNQAPELAESRLPCRLLGFRSLRGLRGGARAQQPPNTLALLRRPHGEELKNLLTKID